MRNFLALAVILCAQILYAQAPKGLKNEQSLPDRYQHVVKDALRFCQPKKGLWIDLGAGKGQVAIPLVEATSNPVVMFDPDAKAMMQGMETAKEKGLQTQLIPVVGVAEKMPFPDNSVDLVVSRGAIFFFDDPVKGLKEVYRVLRPGAKAYIGGGAGSTYAKWAAERLIQKRKAMMKGEDADKWTKFVDLRRPEQMRKWAEEAGLPNFEVMGKGALSAEDERVGQGVWLLFGKTAASESVASKTFQASYGTGTHIIDVATGSPGELGLLEALAAEFNKSHDTTIQWWKAGSGRSLQLLREKKVDAALVHAPDAEKTAVAEGWASNRTLLGSNEFYIVGPKDDPAGIVTATSAANAFARIFRAKAKFLSRGDNSGTHKKEMAIWKRANIVPAGNWYIVTNDFMLGTLRKANETQGYFMTDSSTWVVAKDDLNRLAVLFKGDPVLVNVYHGVSQPGNGEKQKCAQQFLQFLPTKKAQEIVRCFGKERYGEALYHNAAYAGRFDH